jgi:phospholipase D-like protein
MMQRMARLYLLMFGLEILLTIAALISCLSAEEDDVRALPRLVWVVAILLFPLVGAIVYFVAGRPLTAGASGGTWTASGGGAEAHRPQRTVAPDDDPEFLRAIDRRSRAADEDLLRRWEEDLRRREDELRKNDRSRDDSSPSDG